VADGETLTRAAGDALRITRALGGYVVSSRVASGEDGTASLSVRVPAAAAQDAIEQLSALGTIVDQQVQVDDLQATLDALELQLRRTRTALASVRARLRSDELAPTERARLQARRDELQRALASLVAQQAETARQAAEATIQLELRTERSAGIVPVPTRLDRTIDRALDVLAWEAVTVLGLVIVLAPLALLVAIATAARRTARRREDARLLGAA
jgi:chromosome segregation ATPase